MAKQISKSTGGTGMSFQLPAIRKLCQDACQHLMLHPYITAQEQAAKTNVLTVVRNQVFSVMYSLGGCG